MFAQFKTIPNWTEKYKQYDIFDYIFCCFLACSIVFFEERTTYLNNAYLLFNVLNSGGITIEHSRYLAAIPQFPAFLAAKIGLGIGTVAFCLSIGYQLFHFIIFYLVKHRFKQKALGIVYLSVLLLAMHESMFDLVTETKLALSCAVLFLGFIMHKHTINGIKDWIFIAIILAAGVVSHPVFLLYFIIIMVSFWAYTGIYHWPSLLVFGLLFFIFKLGFAPSSYENSIYSQVILFHGFDNSFLHQYLLNSFTKYYKLLFILFLTALSLLYRSNLKRQWLVSILTFVGVYFLLAVLNAKVESDLMIQKTLLPLHFAMLLPLVFIYDKMPNRLIVNIVWPLVLIMSLNTIDNASVKYTQRTDKLLAQMEQLKQKGNKLIINENQINRTIMMETWALPYETAVLSKWKMNQSVVLVKTTKLQEVNEIDFVHIFGENISIEQLNPIYFNFNPSEVSQQVDSTFMLD